LNKRIHRLYGGDPTVTNPTRLMRLPGTIAWAWKPGRRPELTYFVRDDDRPRSYVIGLLVSQLPPEEAWQGSSARPSGFRTGLNTAAELIRAIQAGEEWHNNMVRLTAHWIGRGWSNAEILTAAESFTLPGYTQAQTRAEVLKAIEGGRKRWGVPDQEPLIAAEPNSPFPSRPVDFWDTLQSPEFPIHVLPPVLQRFVETRSRVMGADPCALAWACLSACSAALDGSIRLAMKRHEPWTVPPALWVALIGAPSTKKSPIISAAWHPLEREQAADLREYARSLAEWKALAKSEREQTPEPSSPRRLVTHDATMEKLQDMLSNQTRGLGVLRDELAGFISGMDRYAAGKGGGERAFFLQAFNGGPYVCDRIGRGTSAIENLLVAICGGIQPDRLAQFGDLTDDGLWQRFVPIIVRPSEKDIDEPVGPDEDAYADLIRRLLKVPAGSRMMLSEPSHAVRERIANELFELERAEPLGGKFASFVGKLTGIWGRLALVLSQLEPEGLAWHVIHERAAEAARVLVTKCVLPNASRVYMTIGDQKRGLEDTQTIAGYILAKRVDRLLASDLGRKVRGTFRNLGLIEINKLLSPMVVGGWLMPEVDTPGNKVWRVNPSVHSSFSNRAQLEAKRRIDQRALLHGDEGDEE
jgi:hypothetical protein